MWLNHLKVAFRSLSKHKLVAGINITGLGLGILCSLMVIIYVKNELSYDRWVPEQENIYRLYRAWGNNLNGLTSPAPMADAMRENIAGLEVVTRVATNEDMLLTFQEEFHRVPVMISVDQYFLDCIPLPLAQGNPSTALDEPNSALISEKLAQQIFGNSSPIGQQLLLENSYNITIKGVMAANQGPSHLRGDLFLSEMDEMTGSWTGGYGQIYTRLMPNVNPNQVSDQVAQLYSQEIEKIYKENQLTFDAAKMPAWKLQAFSAVHIESNRMGESNPLGGSFRQVSIISLLGIVILLLAIINYINLATAQLNKKSEEIGVRKVIGATQKHLIDQFVGNALVHVVLGLGLALCLVPYVLPYFNEMVSRELVPKDLFNLGGGLLIVGLSILVALLTGVLPGLHYARLNPINSIRHKKHGRQRFPLRNALVVVQFTLSIGTLLLVSLVSQQLNFMLEKDLGFNGDQVVVLRLNESETVDQFQQQKERLANIKGVRSVSQAARLPGDYISNYQFRLEGKEGRASVNVLFGDVDLQSTLGFELQEGRYFSREYKNDAAGSFVVNEAFVKAYGLEAPLGYQVNFVQDSTIGQVIGVVKDFHYESLEKNIAPLIISSNTEMPWMGRVAVNIDGASIASAMPEIQRFWKQLEPGFPVTQYFLDARFQSLYDQHLRFKRSLSYTAVVGVFIALLGLLGLTLFVTQQRTKEIGIRKVLGASISSIVQLLSKDLLKLVGLGVLIALPISWWLLQRWLTNFAYQTNISWVSIALFILLALCLAWLTMSIQSIRVAVANPVDSLTDE